jgi:transposase
MSATIDIDAALPEVWAVLTDLSSYREWNPLFVDAAGNVAVGQRITRRPGRPAG